MPETITLLLSPAGEKKYLRYVELRAAKHQALPSEVEKLVSPPTKKEASGTVVRSWDDIPWDWRTAEASFPTFFLMRLVEVLPPEHFRLMTVSKTWLQDKILGSYDSGPLKLEYIRECRIQGLEALICDCCDTMASKLRITADGNRVCETCVETEHIICPSCDKPVHRSKAKYHLCGQYYCPRCWSWFASMGFADKHD